MKKENTFIAKNTFFGVMVGVSFMLAAFVFYKTGRSVGFNPQLGNVFLLLTVAGVFIGVRKYREEQLSGYIDYPTALGACVYIVAVGSVLYGMFLYNLYSRSPELQEQYLSAIELFLDEVYKGTPLLDTMKEMMRKFVSPLFIAFAEVVNKCLTGFFFSLFIAGILRRKRPGDLPAV